VRAVIASGTSRVLVTPAVTLSGISTLLVLSSGASRLRRRRRRRAAARAGRRVAVVASARDAERRVSDARADRLEQVRPGDRVVVRERPLELRQHRRREAVGVRSDLDDRRHDVDVLQPPLPSTIAARSTRSRGSRRTGRSGTRSGTRGGPRSRSRRACCDRRTRRSRARRSRAGSCRSGRSHRAREVERRVEVVQELDRPDVLREAAADGAPMISSNPDPVRSRASASWRHAGVVLGDRSVADLTNSTTAVTRPSSRAGRTRVARLGGLERARDGELRALRRDGASLAARFTCTSRATATARGDRPRRRTCSPPRA